MKWILLKVLLVSLLMTGIPSCDDDCGNDSVTYRIDDYQFMIGSVIGSSEEDSVHISEFWVVMKADSLIIVDQMPSNSGFLFGAYACSPAIRLENDVNELQISATDTLNFLGDDYPPGSDITHFFELPSFWYQFDDFQETVGFGFDRIPSRGFTTRFLFSVETREKNGPEVKTYESNEVTVYF